MTDEQMASTANEYFASFLQTATSKKAVLVPSDSASAPATLASVQRVSDRIIDAAGLRGKYRWQVTVVKSSTPNAFVLANGKIVVFTGLLPVVRNEAGLAAVIGHEVAHVVAKHGAERMSQTLLAQAALDAADAYVASKDPKNRASVAAALGIGAQYGVLMPFSRQHESEADRIGQIYMAKAGFDPAEAIQVWVRMAAIEGKTGSEFASTHPLSTTRQQQLRAWLPEAQLYFADKNRPLPNNIDELKVARAERELENSAAPLGLQPSFKEGYWYRTKRTLDGQEITFKYESIKPCGDSSCITIIGSANSKSTLSTDGRLYRTENPTGGVTIFSPPVRIVRYPLRVGDEWQELIEVESPNGLKRKALYKSQILAYESVTTPAGTFMAYKVLSTANGTKFHEGWYVPEVRAMVKAISYTSSGESTSLLMDYQKTDDVSGEMMQQ